uniref:Protein kinase domain-containing protein n=1 Tax=Neospora caninum (strain Liverpool) TaxID=572307 RepID=F0JB38_NEOCL|nr:hypothetical protein NCLIV_069610 [Neospora caninum Liverpool]CEL71305.1 TPA: hypothetical protein BN1204_069610 [Neospora caninum Liverpool]
MLSARKASGCSGSGGPIELQDLVENSKGDRFTENSPSLRTGQTAQVRSNPGMSSASFLPVDGTFRNTHADIRRTETFPATPPSAKEGQSVSWSENGCSLESDTSNLSQHFVARWGGLASCSGLSFVKTLRVPRVTAASHSSEPLRIPGRGNEARASLQVEMSKGTTDAQKPAECGQINDPLLPVNNGSSAGTAGLASPTGANKAPPSSSVTSGVTSSALILSSTQSSLAAGSSCCTSSSVMKPLGTDTGVRLAKCNSNASTECTLSGETSQRSSNDSAPRSHADLGESYCGRCRQAGCDGCWSASFRPRLRRTTTVQVRSAPLPDVPDRASSFPDPHCDAIQWQRAVLRCRQSLTSSTIAGLSKFSSSGSVNQMPGTNCREVSAGANDSTLCKQGPVGSGQEDAVTLCRSRHQNSGSVRGSVISAGSCKLSADYITWTSQERHAQAEASSRSLPDASGGNATEFAVSKQRTRRGSGGHSPNLSEDTWFSVSPQETSERHQTVEAGAPSLCLDSSAPGKGDKTLREQGIGLPRISETPPHSHCSRRSCSAKAHTPHRVGFSRYQHSVCGSAIPLEDAFACDARPSRNYIKPCQENSKKTGTVVSEEVTRRQTRGSRPNKGGLGYSASSASAADTSNSFPQAAAAESWPVWKTKTDTGGAGSQRNSKPLVSYEKPTAPRVEGMGHTQFPITGAELVKRHSDWLTEFEQAEAAEVRDVWYWGRSRQAPSGEPVKGKDCHNNGFDDSRGDYRASLGDHVNYRFELVAPLGRGSFGQVFRAFDHKTGECVALKIVRNKKHFHVQGCVEVRTLQKLLQSDKDDKGNVIHMKEHFLFRNHLIITFELLNMNLYEFLKRNMFRGLSSLAIRSIGIQLLQALRLLRRQQIVHCDLKPENIVLKNQLKSSIKVIDFGSSCPEGEMPYSYIQSRFYRSPEVLLGLSYGCPIDMWSLGCILAELQTGHPLFAGENETDQISCIMEILGPPPQYIIAKSPRRRFFFDTNGDPKPHVNSHGKKRRVSSKDLFSVLQTDDTQLVDFIRGKELKLCVDTDVDGLCTGTGSCDRKSLDDSCCGANLRQITSILQAEPLVCGEARENLYLNRKQHANKTDIIALTGKIRHSPGQQTAHYESTIYNCTVAYK